MLYLNDKYFTEVKNEKYIIHNNKIYQQTQTSKSLKTGYEIINNGKIRKRKIVIQPENNTLSLTDKIQLNKNI